MIIRRIKNIILFIITLLAIFLLDFVIYKNIDNLIPKHQDELRTFANDSNNKENYNFMYELCGQIENTDNYRKVLKDINIIKENEIIYNIIKNYIYEEEIENTYNIDVELSKLYIGDLSNTIYGDLKFVTSRYVSSKYINSNYYIAYSEDMKKICYYNLNSVIYDERDVSSAVVYDSEELGLESEKVQTDKNKEDFIKNVKQEFSKIMKNVEFNPNTIYNRAGAYILEDEQKDITIYYNQEKNNIFGFYMGFGI